MKQRAFLRLLVLLGLLLLALPGTAPLTHAADLPPRIQLSATTAHPGDQLSMIGFGFLSQEPVMIDFDQLPVAQVTATNIGVLVNATFTVPLTATVGVHTVQAVGSQSGSTASVTLTVEAGTQASTPPDGTLLRNRANGRIFLIWSGTRHWIASPKVFETLGLRHDQVKSVPPRQIAALPDGPKLTLHGVHGLIFPLDPISSGSARLTLSQPGAPISGTITLSGTGFGAGEAVQVTFAGATTTVTTTVQGTFQTAISMPANQPVGARLLAVAYGTSTGILQVEPVTITDSAAQPQLSQISMAVPSGHSVPVSGTGFAPGEPVDVFLAEGAAVGSGTADHTGAFSGVRLTIPTSLATGQYPLFAVGRRSFLYAETTLSVAAPLPITATLSLTPTSARPGDQIRATGTGFTPNELVQVTLSGTSVLSVTATTNGSFSHVPFTIPATLATGTYTVQATGATSHASARATLTIQGAPKPAAFSNGELLRDTSNGRVYLLWSGAAHWITSRTAFTTLGYSFGTVINFPHGVISSLPHGADLTLHQVSGLLYPLSPIASGTAEVRVSPPAGAPGAQISIAGTGFGHNEMVQLTLGTATFTTPTNSNGDFQATLPIPGDARVGSTVQIYVYGLSSTVLEVEPISVISSAAAPQLHVTSSSIVPGHTAQIDGTGFGAGEQITLFLADGKSVSKVTSNGSGAFTGATLQVPQSLSPGSYPLVASGTTSHLYVATSLTVSAPPPPAPTFSNGELVRDTSNGRIYVLWNGIAHWITNGAAFTTLGLSYDAVVNLPHNVLATLPQGAGLSLRQTGGRTYPLSPITSGTAMVSFTPPANAPGTQVGLTGTGFGRNETVQLTLGSTAFSVVADNNGAFQATLTIPSDATVGTTLRVYVYGTSSKVLEVEPLPVISAAPPPQLNVAPSNVVAGNTVQVNSSGFAAGEAVTLFLADGQSVATATTNGGGTFSGVSLKVPGFLSAGSYTLFAYGTVSHLYARASVTVIALPATPATITLNTTTANPGSLVLASGTGFAAGEQVTIRLNGKTALVVTTNGSGQFSNAGFTVPVATAAGTYPVQAAGGTSGRQATAGLTVVAYTPSVSITPGSGTPRTAIYVTGQGFAPNESVTLALNGVALVTSPSAIKTSASGTFSATFVIPSSALSGANTVTATGVTSRATATATLSVALPVQSTWYFAGGSTQGLDRTEIALVNPNDQPSSVTFSFMFTAGAPVPYTTTVPPHSRATVDVGSIVGSGRIVFTAITADRKIGAEQTIYRNGEDFSSTIGVSAPQKIWYLAEGYTGLTFHEYIRIFNPNTVTANTTLHLLPFNGRPPLTVPETVAPQSGLVVDVNALAPSQSLAAIVNSDQPVVVDRLITFGPGGYGATEQMGSNTASSTWFFAEGSTLNNFQTFLTILNPSNSQQAVVTATFFDHLGNVLGNATVDVDPLHRGNIQVGNYVRSSGIATILTSNVPVFVERPLYFGAPNSTTSGSGGSVVFGRNGGGVSWLFPEGETLGSYREFLLLQNPSLLAADVRVRFFTTTGQVVDYTLTVPAKSRATIDVLRDVPAVVPSQHSALITSTNGVPIIAEQSIYSDNFTKGDGVAGIAQ